MLKSIFANRKYIPLISLILAGETIFFLPFILARIFRPTILLVFNITNTELGSYFSLYGIIAMISYFFGGPLADKFPARYLMSIALWLTGFGGLFLALVPLKETLFILYGFWGFTTILLFWAALIRATREWGGTEFQGHAFGWLEGGRGAAAALLGTLALLVFSSFNPEAQSIDTISRERVSAFQNVLLLTSLFTIFTGFLVWLFVPDNQDSRPRSSIKIGQIVKLIRLPALWLISIIIVCAYVGYKITDDFSLYANEVLGFNEVLSAGIGTASLWIRAVVAVTAGYLADRFKASKIITICFAISMIGGFLLSTGYIEHMAVLVILNLSFILIGIYGARAIYFALIEESGIPIVFTGTVVGIVSVLGFTPDIFMSPWMGYLLDNNPGNTGHQRVFLVLVLFAFIGVIASLAFRLSNKSKNSLF